MIPVVPAIIPKSEDELKALLPELRFSPEVHLDVVDGVYVPYKSWPYEPTGDILSIKHLTDSYTLEVDLMVDNPIKAAKAWILAGADMLVFHTDNISVGDFQDFIINTHVSVAIAATPDVSLLSLRPYLEAADGVQLMGIEKVGAQGQPFAESVLEKIREVKGAFPNLPITIDGSVNKDTIARLTRAGADRFICGSSIVKEDNKRAAYQELLQLTNI